jgi:hypothetical protein
MSGRTLSYSRPADILELMREGFLTIEEARRHYQAAGGNPAVFEAFVRANRRELVSDAEAGL